MGVVRIVPAMRVSFGDGVVRIVLVLLACGLKCRQKKSTIVITVMILLLYGLNCREEIN